ncbi:DoxX family protein [Corynebacterium pelargi]|uniref:Oxidoreductase MhqP n=1 Tax=Corynebacterium pelargi TaxID=1471400 RepID=A0A410W9Y9_9CORY|nr:DoxX family protein [Corynebacterium pelargi]QAU52767.1 Putative oxidoreductase MhqP [Corynebacterium pelargi]GGG78637.1 membrane protein [Corynebacterium pelargi]
MDRPAIRDAALLILRLVLGVVFVAHGYQKFFLQGITEVTGQFSALGIPQPKLSAVLAASSELIGGSLLIVGLLTTFVAGALALLMMAAMYFVHMGSGFFLEDGGIEYPLVLIAALFIVVIFGSGRASVDGVLSRAEL